MAMAHENETRVVSLVDLPAMRRLGHKATILDSALAYTQTLSEPNTATLTNLLLPNRKVHTLLTRNNGDQVIGQFRLNGHGQNAHIIYIAPAMEDTTDDTAWLHILDGMAQEAGQREAHALIAEVREDDCLFEAMRSAGFAVYSRRQIWQKTAGAITLSVESQVTITPAEDADTPGVQSLIAQIVPALMQPFIMPDGDMDGWIYRQGEQVMAYIGSTVGNRGIYLMPFIHPDVMNDTNVIITSLLMQISKADSLPIYVNVSRYLDWIGTSLEKLGFEAGSRQAVMVRHITAGIRQASFKPIAVPGETVTSSGEIPTMFRRITNYRWKFRTVFKRLKYRLWKDTLLTI